MTAHLKFKCWTNNLPMNTFRFCWVFCVRNGFFFFIQCVSKSSQLISICSINFVTYFHNTDFITSVGKHECEECVLLTSHSIRATSNGLQIQIDCHPWWEQFSLLWLKFLVQWIQAFRAFRLLLSVYKANERQSRNQPAPNICDFPWCHMIAQSLY